MTESGTPKGARRGTWAILPALGIALLAFDQFTKYLVQTRLTPYQPVNPVPALAHLFTLDFITNTGAAFGIMQDRSLMFIIIAVVVSAGILLYFRHIPEHEWLIKVSLAMQLGGAMGNLLDRIRLGYVVDFVDFRAWPVFNFADTFIVVGVMLLAYRLLLYPETPAHVAAGPSGPGSEPGSDTPPRAEM